MFTQKEINEVNSKTELSFRYDVQVLIRNKFGKDKVYTEQEIVDIFAWLFYKIIFVPDKLKMGLDKGE